jgi:hypothetical protein
METRSFSVEMAEDGDPVTKLQALAARHGWTVIDVSPSFDATGGSALARFLTLVAEGEDLTGFTQAMLSEPGIADILPEAPAEPIRARRPDP